MTIYDYQQYWDFKGYCPGRDVLSQSLDLYGSWEITETDLAASILKIGPNTRIVIDAGAHIGWYTRLAISYGYKTIGYEGNEHNIGLYRINNPDAPIHKVWFDETLTETSDVESPIHLLKIDVEGEEQHVIRYFEPGLGNIYNILMEVSPVFNDSYPALIEHLCTNGFSVRNLDGTPFDFKYDFTQTNLWLTRM